MFTNDCKDIGILLNAGEPVKVGWLYILIKELAGNTFTEAQQETYFFHSKIKYPLPTHSHVISPPELCAHNFFELNNTITNNNI
ncbi:MAG: hypothetical protein H0U27_13460 [Nitrosopumilus sp.]|nr:hypothetical protein [Nitrosopumilus sp.]